MSSTKQPLPLHLIPICGAIGFFLPLFHYYATDSAELTALILFMFCSSAAGLLAGFGFVVGSRFESKNARQLAVLITVILSALAIAGAASAYFVLFP